MTTTAAPANDIFSAFDQFDVDAPFLAVETVPAPVAVECKGCGRPLRAAKSRAQGRGRACQTKHDAKIAAALADETPVQAEKARELIADGGIIQVAGTLYLAVSSDGAVRYEVNPVTGQCSCKAGQHGRRCYHLIGAVALAAA